MTTEPCEPQEKHADCLIDTNFACYIVCMCVQKSAVDCNPVLEKFCSFLIKFILWITNLVFFFLSVPLLSAISRAIPPPSPPLATPDEGSPSIHAVSRLLPRTGAGHGPAGRRGGSVAVCSVSYFYPDSPHSFGGCGKSRFPCA